MNEANRLRMNNTYGLKNTIFNFLIFIISAGLASCSDRKEVNIEAETFSSTLNKHLNAVHGRNLDELSPTVADSVLLISPDGDLLQSKVGFIELHKNWFSQPNWNWDYKILKKENRDSLGYALVHYTYTQRDSVDSIQFINRAYLVLIFKNSKEGWQLTHDQNTRIKIN